MADHGEALGASQLAPTSPRGEDRRKELWTRYANAVASDGVPMYDAMLRLKTATHAWRAFLEHLPAGCTGTAADYGCGTGFVTRNLAQRNPGARVIGVDREAAFLGRAERHLTAHPEAELRRGDLTGRLPLADGEVSLVGTHNWVISYLTVREQQGFLRELARVHAPGSTVLGSTMLTPFTFRDVVLSNLHIEILQPRALWVAMRELVPLTIREFDDHMERGWMHYPTVDQLREWHLAVGFRSFEVVAEVMPLHHFIRWRRRASHAAVVFRAVRA